MGEALAEAESHALVDVFIRFGPDAERLVAGLPASGRAFGISYCSDSAGPRSDLRAPSWPIP